MRGDINHAKDWNDLRDLVGSFGLLQYLLCPFVIIVSSVLFFKQQVRFDRGVCGVAGLAAAVCLGMALYRGYFAALGW